MPFYFENLDVYKKSIILVDTTFEICEQLDKSKIPSILDQLKRAVLSIPLNIAEGSGRSGKREKARFYKIGRASLYEIIPIIEILFRRGFIQADTHSRIYHLADEIGRMLNGLIRGTNSPRPHLPIQRQKQ